MTDRIVCEWVSERVYEKKHFTARYLAYLSELINAPPDVVAKGIVGLIVVLLAISEQAHVLGNGILVVVPFLLIYVFPEEKPSDESLYVYFSLFGASVILDRNLEQIPLYYVFKLALFLLLFVPPYRCVEQIDKLIKEKIASQVKEQQEETKKSEGSTKKTLSGRSRPGGSDRSKLEEVPENQIQSSDQSGKTGAVVTSTPQEELKPDSATDQGQGERKNKPGQDMNGPAISQDKNPMATNSFYNLGSGASYDSVGPLNNLNDVLFFPLNQLVFNGPFDYENLTYHMKIINNSHHRIAFAVKGNAVPRVMVYPPCGILELREVRVVAVTVQKFQWNDVDFHKDRIAFDYVILDDAKHKNVKAFEFGLFQKSESKRRKNIKICYNP